MKAMVSSCEIERLMTAVPAPMDSGKVALASGTSLPVVDVDGGDVAVAADVLGEADDVWTDPLDEGDGRGAVGREVLRLAAGGGDEVDVAAGRALIAHQAADEGDLLAVGRPARDGDLQAVERSRRLWWCRGWIGAGCR